ncbi:28S rRNA (cytosine-C(5))-methyltransferase-like [Phlebotomus argentipes]|uniref:28S rRNA (cytosine-C(5))-methyltransferase-like n=1 Tax=Phlebotomus argentipes TaxID=94469 RepID=UPI00289299FA|nr:28S rRNA (cytosine-C(5))-methyltransferase-like [Phlebotomus argentipes]
MVFNHSVKVPTQYKVASKILQKYEEEGASMRSMIYEQKHARINRLCGLITKILQQKPTLDAVIQRSEIMEKEQRLNPFLCKILVAELLIGCGKLNGNSKPVQTVLSYEKKLRKLYKKETEGKEEIVSAPAEELQLPRYIRINTLKVKAREILEILSMEEGWRQLPAAASYTEYLETVQNLQNREFIEDFHVVNLFAFPPNSRRYWATHRLVEDASVVLQNKSSCLAPLLLAPSRKSRVFDMCAAPGLKTIQMAEMMKNKGVIYAAENHDRRYSTLQQFASNSGSTIVQPLFMDSLAVFDNDVPGTEYILLDPSCSGSGVLQQIQTRERTEYDKDRIERLSRLQLKLLCHAMKNFPAVKRIVYSTCSMNIQENEMVVQQALKQFKNFRIKCPLEQLRGEWRNFGSPEVKRIGKNCIYAVPEIDGTTGFFIAVLERKEAR